MHEIIEAEINPEEVWGKNFRIPCVEGGGSGYGFGFRDLNLPRRWEEALPQLNDPYFRQFFEKFAHNVAGRFGLTLQAIFWDEKTGILTSVNLKEGNGCGIYLERNFPQTEDGGYHGHNIDRLDQAHCLFSIVAKFINEILDRIYGYAR